MRSLTTEQMARLMRAGHTVRHTTETYFGYSSNRTGMFHGYNVYDRIGHLRAVIKPATLEVETIDLDTGSWEEVTIQKCESMDEVVDVLVAHMVVLRMGGDKCLD